MSGLGSYTVGFFKHPQQNPHNGWYVNSAFKGISMRQNQPSSKLDGTWPPVTLAGARSRSFLPRIGSNTWDLDMSAAATSRGKASIARLGLSEPHVFTVLSQRSTSAHYQSYDVWDGGVVGGAFPDEVGGGDVRVYYGFLATGLRPGGRYRFGWSEQCWGDPKKYYTEFRARDRWQWLWTEGGGTALNWDLPDPSPGTRELDTSGAPTESGLGYWEYVHLARVDITSGGGKSGIEPTSAAGGSVCYTEPNSFLDGHTFQEPVYS